MYWAQPNLRRLAASQFATFLLCATALATGCSSRSAYVVARQDVRYPLSRTNKIAIAEHAHPRPEEQSLRETLVSELSQQGFSLVASSEAEYTLTFWVDVSWKRGKIVVSNREGTWNDFSSEPGGRYGSAAPPHFRTQPGNYSEQSLRIQHVVDVPWETKGIRLKVFPQASMRAGNLQTAWDGYIEGGDEVSDKRESVLVRTLLNYFGTDFVGRAKWVAVPPNNP